MTFRLHFDVSRAYARTARIEKGRQWGLAAFGIENQPAFAGGSQSGNVAVLFVARHAEPFKGCALQ